ncbi:MAG UNVERIFIED_CONTAM: hypothetical protein LVR18_00345 [Planctomycetaceae bacterium]
MRLQESRRPGILTGGHRGFRPATVLRHLTRPRLGLVLAAVFVTTFGFAQFESTLSLLTQHFGYSNRSNYLLYAYVGFVLSLGQGMLVRRLLPRIGEQRMAACRSAADDAWLWPDWAHQSWCAPSCAALGHSSGGRHWIFVRESVSAVATVAVGWSGRAGGGARNRPESLGAGPHFRPGVWHLTAGLVAFLPVFLWWMFDSWWWAAGPADASHDSAGTGAHG